MNTVKVQKLPNSARLWPKIGLTRVSGLWDVNIVGVLVEFVVVEFVPDESVG